MRKPIIPINLQRGDYKLISKMTGYSVHTVSSQLRGERTLSSKVKEAVIRVMKSREMLLKESESIDIQINRFDEKEQN